MTDTEWEKLPRLVTVDNTVRTATIDLATGTATPSGSYDHPIQMLEQSGDYRAVVIPQTVAAGKPLITITLDGISYSHTLTTPMNYQAGKLHNFTITEGDRVEQGAEVGLIDTTQVWLKIQQAHATKEVYQSQKPDMEKQIAATRQQLAKARQDQQRYKELVADGAAPTKMLDDATNQVKVLERQLEAQMSSLSTSTNALGKQMAATDVQVSQFQDQLRKCHITAPIAGTVLEKYAEQGEFVAPGKPLFKMADTERMFIRAYVTSAQLQNIKVGQKAKVFADYGDGQRKEYDGTVVWISSKSEFTPKTILTDDERADLVYALKVAIRNDGYVKIGMYGEVKFQ